MSEKLTREQIQDIRERAAWPFTIVKTQEILTLCRIAEAQLASLPSSAEVVVPMPAEPTAEMLYVIAHEDYPEDAEVGKAAQLRLGLKVIPPRVEYEIAYGQYQRLRALIAAAPKGLKG